MELKHYYRLTFVSGQEFFIESEVEERSAFLKALSNTGIFTSGNGFITLQREQTDPMDIRADKLFSVQKAPAGMISPQTKLWRII